MNDTAPRESTFPPFGGVALWQAADARLTELFGVAFDFWAWCEQWQPVLERSSTFSASPLQARLMQGAALCERVADTDHAQCCEWDDARLLLGVPVAEHGHLHLVAIGEVDSTTPDALLEMAAAFEKCWNEREAIERQRDVDWHRALVRSRGTQA